MPVFTIADMSKIRSDNSGRRAEGQAISLLLASANRLSFGPRTCWPERAGAVSNRQELLDGHRADADALKPTFLDLEAVPSRLERAGVPRPSFGAQ
jgi:hypothetical protein